jgi:hypothetical protein
MRSSPLMMSSFTMNNILRYEGKASLAMVGLVAGAVLNIAGDPIFMFVFHMGIAGAGLSTALSQCVSFSILLSAFLRGKTQSRLSLRSFHFDRKIWDIVSTGFPSMIRQGLASLSTMVLNHCAARLWRRRDRGHEHRFPRQLLYVRHRLGMGQDSSPSPDIITGEDVLPRAKRVPLYTGALGRTARRDGGNRLFAFAGADRVVSKRPGGRRNRFGGAAVSVCRASVSAALRHEQHDVPDHGQRALASFTAMLRSGLYFIPSSSPFRSDRRLGDRNRAGDRGRAGVFYGASLIAGSFESFRKATRPRLPARIRILSGTQRAYSISNAKTAARRHACTRNEPEPRACCAHF